MVVVRPCGTHPQPHAGQCVQRVIPAWIARLVAAIGRSASSSALAAATYSAALPTYARTWAAVTGRVRLALGTLSGSK